jgi:hypothetical protein
MSWGGILIVLPPGALVADLPHDYQPPPIGTCAQVLATMRAALPDHEHRAGYTNAILEGGYVEFSYMDTERVGFIGVRTSAGPGALEAIEKICAALGLALVDEQTGEVADFGPQTRASLHAYRAWSQEALQERGAGSKYLPAQGKEMGDAASG